MGITCDHSAYRALQQRYSVTVVSLIPGTVVRAVLGADADVLVSGEPFKSVQDHCRKLHIDDFVYLTNEEVPDKFQFAHAYTTQLQ